jgi:PKD repeat protein
MKKIGVLLLFILLTCSMWAAINQYSVADGTSDGNYLNTSQATMLLPPNSYLDMGNAVDIGFPFVYDGMVFTKFKASSGGYISLDPTAVYQSDRDLTLYPKILAPLWDNMHAENGAVYYQLQGTAPNRVMVVEFSDVKWIIGAETDITFQIKLYEGTNKIVFDYLNISTPAYLACIGISGLTAGDCLSIEPTAAGFTVHTNTSYASVGNDHVNYINGRKYILTPPTPPANDLAMAGISGPGAVGIGIAAPVTVTVLNAGSATQSNFTVQLLSNWQGDPIDEQTNTTPLAPGHTRDFTFNWVPSRHIGDVDISGYVILNGDENPDNNYTEMLSVAMFSDYTELSTIGEHDLQYTFPLIFSSNSSVCQTIYTLEEIGSVGTIKSIRLHTDLDSSPGYKPVQIWMGTITDDCFESNVGGPVGKSQRAQQGWVPVSDMTLVYNGSVYFNAGQSDVHFALTTPYQYLGDNLVIMYKRPHDPDTYGYGNKFWHYTTPNARTMIVDSMDDIDVSNLPDGNSFNTNPVLDIFFTPYSGPFCYVSPTSVNFPQRQILTLSQETITVKNYGVQDLEVRSIDINESNPFTLSGVPGLPKTLARNESLQFQINYYPTTPNSVAEDVATITIVTSTDTPGEFQATHEVSARGSAVDHTIYTLPLVESFENFIFGGLPEGWHTYLGDPDSNSSVEVEMIDVSYDGSFALALYQSPDTPEGVYLISPPLSPNIDLDDVRVSFAGILSGWETGLAVQLGMIDDPYDISTFELLDSFVLSHSWQLCSYDLAAYSGTSKRIAFRNCNPQSQYSSMMLDKIKIDYIPEDDMTLVAIEAPDVVIEGETVAVKVDVKNNGSETQSNYTVTLYGSNAPASLGSIVGPSLAAGQTQQVTINWVPAQTGYQDIYAVVDLTDDEDAENDSTFHKTVYVAGSNTTYKEVGLGTAEDYWPINMLYKNTVSQNLYLASEIGKYGAIESIFLFNNFRSNINYRPIKIYMATTWLTSLENNVIPFDDFTLVFDGQLDFPAGENAFFIDLDVNYQYNAGNLVIMYHREDYTWYGDHPFKGDIANNTRCIYWYGDNTIYLPNFDLNNLSLKTNFLAKTGFLFQGSSQPPTGNITVTPAAIDFGTVNPGQWAESRVIIENVGNVDVTVQSIAINENPNIFTYSHNVTLSHVLTPGDTLGVAVTCDGQASGTWNSNLIIDTDAGQELVSLTAYVPSYVIELSPESLDYGNVIVDRFHTKTVKVTNSGNDPFSVTAVNFNVGAPFSFSYPDLPVTLAPGAEVNLSVVFNPTAVGFYEDQMNITTSYGVSEVMVFGYAWDEPLVANPSSVSFGSACSIGQTSTITLTLTHSQNSGLNSVTISNVSLSGAPEFSLGSVSYQGQPVSLPYPLPAGASLQVPVNFLPLEPSQRTATINVSSSEGTLRIPVAGFDVALPQIEVSPGVIFHLVSPVAGVQSSFTIYNRGAGELNYSINAGAFGNYVGFGSSSGTVAANSSANVGYWITDPATTPGLYTYELQISSNDTSNPTVKIPFAYMVVSDLPQGFAAYPTQGDLPLTVQFRIPQNIQGIRYNWDFDNNNTFDSSEREPIHTYTTPGLYSVRLVMMLPTGATRQYVMQNYINVGYEVPALVSNPLSSVEFNQGETGGPYPMAEIFTAPDGAVMQYSVQGSDHISGTVNEWDVMFLTAAPNWWGSEVITVTATDQYNNSVSHQITVNVIHVNAAPTVSLPPDFHFIHRSTYMVDFSEYISDVDNATDDLGITLSRVSGDESIQFVYHPVNQPNIPGQHTVIFSSNLETVQNTRFNLVVNDFQRRAVSSAEFNMHVLDHFDATMSTAETYQFTGQSVQFLDTTLGNPNHWTWDFGDNSPLSHEQNPVHIYQYAGTYDVTLTVKHLYTDNTVNEQDTVENEDYITMQGTSVTQDDMPDEWDIGGSPYNLFGGVSFDDDDAPEIDDGVELNIFGEEPLRISGGFNANNVKFAGPQEGGWAGLSFVGGSRNASSLTNCTITDAALPVSIVGASPVLSGITINTTESRNIRNAQRGIYIGQDSAAQIDSVQIDGYPEGIVIDNQSTLSTTSPTPTLVNIRVRNSTQTSRDGGLVGTGLTLSGAASVSSVDVDGFDTGVNAYNSSTTVTPTLVNIRVRNSTQTSREDAVRGTTGVLVGGNVSIDSLQVDGYNTGVQVDGTQYSTATPTLVNIRVRNSTQTSRDDSDALGLLIGEYAAPEIEDVEILDMPHGIKIEAGDNGGRATPTLVNIRVRNSTQTSRAGSVGLAINNTQNVSINDAEVEGYDQGVQINSTSVAPSTPTLVNIRVRNSTQTSRADGVGVDLSGNVEARLTDFEIEDYPHGLRYQANPEIRAVATPTLVNIRVRNSTQTSRSETYGMQLIDLDRVDLNDIEIEGYQYGLELNNTQSYRAVSTPTLVNIRVRNSTQTSRFDNYGVLLGNNVSGFIKDSTIESAKIGLLLADGNSTTLQPLKIINCGTGIKAISLNRAKTIKGHYIINQPNFMGLHSDWDFIGFDLVGAGPWKIKNNTLLDTKHYLKAEDAQGEFVNNIALTNPAPTQPFILSNSTIGSTFNCIAVPGQNTGEGNFYTQDPMFADPAQGDYSLTPDSPCIDAGSPNESKDADGTVSDVGAYTYLHKVVIQPSHRFISPGTQVQFAIDSMGHNYPGYETTIQWDLGNDGQVDATSEIWTHTFNQVGVYDLKLTVQTGDLVDEMLQTAFIIVQDHQLPAPTGVQISRVSGSFQLTWQPVTSDVNNAPVDVQHYMVYAADDPQGLFSYVGHTSDGETSFTHVQVADTDRCFYIVVGFSGTYRELLDYINANPTIRPAQVTVPSQEITPTIRKQ